MDTNGSWDEDEDEEFEFSRNYFLAKELASSAKKSKHKLTDIDVVDEQVSLIIAILKMMFHSPLLSSPITVRFHNLPGIEGSCIANSTQA